MFRRTPIVEKNFNGRKAQSLLEYVILIGIVTTVFISMGTLFKRGTQGMIKVTADQIGNQINAEQKATLKTGYLVNAYSSSNARNEKGIVDNGGNFTYNYDDETSTLSNSVANLGFTNKEL